MRRIAKTVLTITVLHDAEDDVSSLPVEEIAQEMNNGFCVGTVEHVSTVVVPAAKITEELLACGNDGTFFEDFLDAATDLIPTPELEGEPAFR